MGSVPLEEAGRGPLTGGCGSRRPSVNLQEALAGHHVGRRPGPGLLRLRRCEKRLTSPQPATSCLSGLNGANGDLRGPVLYFAACVVT